MDAHSGAPIGTTITTMRPAYAAGSTVTITVDFSTAGDVDTAGGILVSFTHLTRPTTYSV